MTGRRWLRALLKSAGATVPLTTIDTWTPRQVVIAQQWATAQIEAHRQDAPGTYTSVKWPGFLGEAATNKRRA